MLNRLVAVSRPLVVVILAAIAIPCWAGTVVSREIDSTTLGRKWNINIYLPSGYESGNDKYSVLYLLHGNTHNHTSWATSGHIKETADALIAAGEVPATLIVMPDGGTTWYVDRKEPMESAILRDLIPLIEKEYRVVADRSHRTIAGLSMGGYGTMRFALKYPEMFAAAGLLSPAIYDPAPPENSSARRAGVFGAPEFDPAVWQSLSYPALWQAYRAKNLPVPMYIASGDDDVFHCELSAMQFYQLLRNNDQPAELRIVDGGHNWPLWSTTVGDAMKYMFRFVGKNADGKPADREGERRQSR